MQEVGIGKTTLGEIRSFLLSVDSAPAPWTHPSKPVEALHAMLQSKQNDEQFWSGLKNLTLRLEDQRFNAAALHGADALGSPTADKLLDDLRASLGDNSGKETQTLRQWVTNSIGATALAGFLLLGVATGCDATDEAEDTETDTDTDSDTDTGTETDTGTGTGSGDLCEEAVEEGITGQDGSIFCDLIDIIEAADIQTWQQNTLLDCLPDLDAAFREALLESFQSMSEQEIADELIDMIDYGGECFYEDSH